MAHALSAACRKWSQNNPAGWETWPEHLQGSAHGHRVSGTSNARKCHCAYMCKSWSFATQWSRTSHSGNPVLSSGASGTTGNNFNTLIYVCFLNYWCNGALVLLYVFEITTGGVQRARDKVTYPVWTSLKRSVFALWLTFRLQSWRRKRLFLWPCLPSTQNYRYLNTNSKKYAVAKSVFNCFYLCLLWKFSSSVFWPWMMSWNLLWASTCFMWHKQSTSHSPYTIVLSIPWKVTALSDRNKNGEESLEKEGCMRKVLGDDLLLSSFL